MNETTFSEHSSAKRRLTVRQTVSWTRPHSWTTRIRWLRDRVTRGLRARLFNYRESALAWQTVARYHLSVSVSILNFSVKYIAFKTNEIHASLEVQGLRKSVPMARAMVAVHNEGLSLLKHPDSEHFRALAGSARRRVR